MCTNRAPRLGQPAGVDARLHVGSRVDLAHCLRGSYVPVSDQHRSNGAGSCDGPNPDEGAGSNAARPWCTWLHLRVRSGCFDVGEGDTEAAGGELLQIGEPGPGFGGRHCRAGSVVVGEVER